MQFELLKEEDLEEVILLCDEVFEEHTDLAYALSLTVAEYKKSHKPL